MPSNTITLANSITWASLMTGNRPLQLQSTQEPALTAANIIIQAMLAPPFKWNWNRSAVNFFTVDPTGWQANYSVFLGYQIMDNNGNMQTVTTAGITGATVPAWVFNGTTTNDGTAVWTQNGQGIVDYIISIPDFGFIENATCQSEPAVKVPVRGTIYDIPNKTQILTAGNDPPARPQNIAPVFDDNAGNITFRCMPSLPDAWYRIVLTYQKRAALMTSSASVWPIPDMFSLIYQQGFLGLIWLFADDPRGPFMLQKFAASVLAIADGLTVQEQNSFLAQWDIMAASRRAAAYAQQGVGARAAQ